MVRRSRWQRKRAKKISFSLVERWNRWRESRRTTRTGIMTTYRRHGSHWTWIFSDHFSGNDPVSLLDLRDALMTDGDYYMHRRISSLIEGRSAALRPRRPPVGDGPQGDLKSSLAPEKSPAIERFADICSDTPGKCKGVSYSQHRAPARPEKRRGCESYRRNVPTDTLR